MRLDRSAIVNFGLLALALATALSLVLTRARPTRDELDARARNLVPEFRPERLKRLVISSGGTKLELRAEATTDAGAKAYRLGPGPGRDADPDAVRALLSALELAAFLKRLEPESADRSALGFLPPRAEISIELEGSRGQVSIGKAALTPRDTTYVEVRGFGDGETRLGLVRSSTLGEILLSEDSLRPQWLVPYAGSELVGLVLKGGNAPALELERHDGPAFRVKSGQRVSRPATERFLLELSRARADRGLAEARAAFTAESVLRVEFVPSDQRPRAVIEVGNECTPEADRFALRRLAPSPGTFCVDAALKAALLELLANPADDAVFSLRTDEVESLSIEREGKRLELRRSERGFELGSTPKLVPVELGAGNRRLDELLGVHGRRLPEPDRKALGLEPPSGSVSLRSSTIERAPKFTETVLLGKAQLDGSLPVSRAYDGVVLVLAPESARALSGDASSLRARRVLDFGPSELRSLSVSANGERQRLRRTEAGVFELLEPRGFNHDAGLVLDLIQTLGTLEADRWVSEQDDGRLGLAKPLARIEAELLRAGAPQRFLLEIGAETSGGYFARLDSAPGAFVLPKPLVHDLTTSLLARDVFVVDPGRLTGLTLRVGERRLKLERHDGGFRASAGTPELAPALVERIVALASSLRAEAAIHTGPARANEALAQAQIELELRVATPSPELVAIRIGAESSFRGSPIRFARRSGVDATYGIASAIVRELAETL